jgi:hypothetical protein
MPGEDPVAYEELRDGVREELSPGGALESVLVDRIVSLMWRLRRLTTIDAGIFAWGYFGALADRAGKKAADHVERVDMISPLCRDGFVERVTNKEEYTEALSEQREFEAEQASDLSRAGEIFVRDSRSENAFSKLSRYETSIERSLIRTLDEFPRLKAAREGKNVPVPVAVAVDIDISGVEAR